MSPISERRIPFDLRSSLKFGNAEVGKISGHKKFLTALSQNQGYLIDKIRAL